MLFECYIYFFICSYIRKLKHRCTGESINYVGNILKMFGPVTDFTSQFCCNLCKNRMFMVELVASLERNKRFSIALRSLKWSDVHQ